jgi:predicted transcriptional regulator YheO
MIEQNPFHPHPYDFELLRRIAVAITALFSPYCEVVIHDFSNLEHSIVHLEGNITGRSLGGSATDLLISQVSSGDTAEDPTNYLTSLAQGRVMKSCTVFLRDEDGKACGAFCVNFDITPFLGFQNHLSKFLATDERNEITELLSDDLRETLHSVIAQTLYQMGESHAILDRDAKVELIRRLDEKGIFQVNKAVPLLADLLGFSRATVYNYLRDARSSRASPSGDGHSVEPVPR